MVTREWHTYTHLQKTHRETGEDRTGERKRARLRKSAQVRSGYLSGDLLGAQQLLLSSLELLKHFISLVLSNTHFLFQLSYFIL